MTNNDTALFINPLVAILRSVQTSEVVDIGKVIIENGIRLIEVPMNSVDPILSIKALVDNLGDQAIFGGGTVLNVDQVNQIHEVGGQLIVSPNCNPEVIRRAIDLKMQPMPGVATATEVFTAIDAGAKILKLFPAAGVGVVTLKNIMAVLPEGITICAVGGINPENMQDFWQAGARGFGIGGDIFKPGDTVAEVAEKTSLVTKVFKSLK